MTNQKTNNVMEFVDLTNNKVYVRINLSEDGNSWERWVSSDKKNWEISDKYLSLEDVLKSQQDIINNNYLNLFKIITEK
jgi:hypothetical protein